MRMMSALLLLILTWPRLASAAQLRLTWEDNTSNEAGFLIERRMQTEDMFTPLTTVSMNITAYVDYTAEAGTIYCYRVRAFSAEKDSAPSNDVCWPRVLTSALSARPAGPERANDGSLERLASLHWLP